MLKQKTTGFTLLEILIALFVFSIVSIILGTGLHTILSNQTSTDKNAARFAELQMALTILSRDFEQVIDRPITLANGALEDAFVGSNNTATFSHAGFTNPLGQQQRSTLQRTRYRLEKDTLLRESWLELDQAKQTPPTQRKLLTGATQLAFEFLDKSGNFQNRWPPAELGNNVELPRAVRIRITLSDLGKVSQTYIIPGQKLDKPG